MRLGRDLLPDSPQLSLRRLNFDDVGAEVGQDGCSTRPGNEARQIHDLQSGKYVAFCHFYLLLPDHRFGQPVVWNFEVAGNVLLSLKLRRAFLEKRRRTFFLVVGRGADGEKRGFDEQAFGHARLQSFVNRLKRVLHTKRSVRNDLLKHSFGTLDELRVWHQFVHQANAISLSCIDDVAGEDKLEGSASPDQTRHALRASIAGHDSKLYFWLAEFRTLSSD